MCELSPVSFHGDTIFVITIHDQPYTAMKPIVENLGLGWASQSQKLNANKTRWGVTIIVIPSEGGEQETLCMPVRKLPAYLASINPKKVREELRAKIELYQDESDDALWNYWMNGRAERGDGGANASLTPDQQCTLRAIVKAKIGEEKNRGKLMQLYSQVWSRFANHFRVAKYCQLPQSKMSEAIQYLVSMEIRQKTAVEEEKKEKELSFSDITLEEPVYQHKKRFFDQLGKIRMELESLREVMHLVVRPGSRLAVLPVDRQVLYDNMNDSVNTAVTGVNIAIYGLRSACRIGSRVDFMKR